MSRTIKFRAKRSFSDGWVYGSLITEHVHYGTAILEHGVINNAVIPETVGQFTGLHDKNGKEVYEGDVYFQEIDQDYGDDRNYYVVTWINEWGMFALLSISEYNEYLDTGIEHLDDGGVPYNLEPDSFDLLHYAGDIHSKPELLKQ